MASSSTASSPSSSHGSGSSGICSRANGGYNYNQYAPPTTQHQNKVLTFIGIGVLAFMFLVNEVLPALSPSSQLSLEDRKQLDFALARRESYGFFDDVGSYQWNLMKERVRERVNHNDRVLGHRSKILYLDEPNAWYQNNWEPDFTCQHERRVGGMGNGGKWICDPHRIARMADERGSCLVYSFGPLGDLKLEYGLHELLAEHRNCEIHVFDNSKHYATYDKLPNLDDNVHFHPWSLEGSESVSQSRRFMTLQETVETLGHQKRIIDVFKLKCTDGCEWKTYKDWFNSDVVMLQILVEVHDSPALVANDFFETMQKLNYVTSHKEPNTHFCAGRCQNYSFLKLAPEFFTTTTTS